MITFFVVVGIFISIAYVMQVISFSLLLLEPNSYKSKEEFFKYLIPFFVSVPMQMFKSFKNLPRK